MLKFATALIGLLSALPTSGLMAATVPAGTYLEVRLSHESGSRVSRPGDKISATVIAPVVSEHRLLLPPGANLSGSVLRAERVGFGPRHLTARLEYSFDRLQLADGRVFPMETSVREVETAKERVNETGVIGGINPAANFSSGASVLISALVVEPHVAATMLALKFLIARSPDPEIYFPAGTEVLLQLRNAMPLPDVPAGFGLVKPLGPDEAARVAHVLQTLPQQQAEQGHDRPSDLLNVVFLGTPDQIDRAFRAAGWTGEGRRSVLAVYRMYHCMVQRMGYLAAPMSKMTLNGVAPDSAYQKSLNTFSKRHHIRVWSQVEAGVSLGAATEDISYNFHRFHLSHATDPNVDSERAKVVNDLWMTGCVDSASMLERDNLRVLERQDSPILTDNGVAVVRVNDCRSAENRPGDFQRASSKTEGSRFGQALRAVRADIARSDPFLLAYYVAKSFSDHKAEEQKAAPPAPEKQLAQRTDKVAVTVRPKQRPSVIDSYEQSAPPQLERVSTASAMR